MIVQRIIFRSNKNALTLRSILAWIAVVSLTVLSCVGTVMASVQPFVDRGIDPHVMNMAASSLSQKKAYISDLIVEITENGKTEKDTAFVVFDPFTEYGIDFYLKFNKLSDTSESFLQKAEYRSMLSRIMRLQHRLQTLGNQYDPDSITVEQEDGDDAVISFKFASYGLPQDIAYMRFLKGRAFIIDGELDRIEVGNEQPFSHNFKRYHNYQTVSKFRQAEAGDYLLVSKTISFSGVSWGKPFKALLKAEIIQYRDADGNITTLRPGMPVEFPDDEFETVRVKLDRTLPFYGKAVRKQGFDLPMPFGVQGIYRYQDNYLDFTHFTIDGSNDFETVFDPAGSDATVSTNMIGARADMYIFPFLNVSAFVGKAQSDANLQIRTTDEFKDFIGWLGGDLPEYLSLDLELDNTIAGLGMTAALGYKNYFASITGSYAASVTESAGTTAHIWTANPIVGYQFPDYRLRFLLGAEYIKLNREMVGTINLPDGTSFDFNIGVDTDEWAGLIGLQKEFGSHFETVFMYGQGPDRQSFTITGGYRF